VYEPQPVIAPPRSGQIEHGLDDADLNPGFHVVNPSAPVLRETMTTLDAGAISGGTQTIHMRRTRILGAAGAEERP
jgi:hypothetical protein